MPPPSSKRRRNNGPSSSITGSNNVALPGTASASASSSAAAGAADPSQSNMTVLVSSLPPAYTSESLSALLSGIGPIRAAFLVTTPGGSDSSKTSKGYGFGKFVLKEDAQKAIQDLDGTLIDGKRISVKWAKRRQREDRRPGKGLVGIKEEEEVDFNDNKDFISLDSAAGSASKNVQNAYAQRREAKRLSKLDGAPASDGIDNAKDSRTIILSGGLDANLGEEKKALLKKLKKLAFTVNTGMGALDASQLSVTPSTTAAYSSGVTATDQEEAGPEASTSSALADAATPTVLVECPSSKVAHELAAKLHNSVLKGHLVHAKNKWENDLCTRKGWESTGGGRLIVRNLAFEVTVADLLSAFISFGALHSLTLHKGYAFLTYLSRKCAAAALEGMNGKRIYSGMAADRIAEAAQHELSSVKRKKEKGRIVGVKGRVCAVDWAVKKSEYEKLENGQLNADGEEEKDVDMRDAKDEEDDEDEDEDEDSDVSGVLLDDEDEDEDEDMTPIPEDELVKELEPPSDAELSDGEGKGKSQDAADQDNTLFVRNIQFEATEDELFTLFKAFGPVRYARIVMDPTTKRSRGTGFVNFYKTSDADSCLSLNAALVSQQTGLNPASNGPSSIFSNKHRQDSRLNSTHSSLLTADPSSASASRFTLHGRVLGVSRAVGKDRADKLREDRDRAGKGGKDRRNLYLMHEGVILPESPLATSLSTADVQNRQSSFEARRSLLRTNPALYISRTRLAVRQIPLYVSEGALKRFVGWCVKAYDNDVKKGRRSPLTPDELEGDDPRGTAKGAAEEDVADEDAGEGDGKEKAGKKSLKKSKKESKVQQAKVLRQDDRVDPLNGLGRSRGYGFLELKTHADALKVLRFGNGNAAIMPLFVSWWREELKLQAERLEALADPADAAKKEAAAAAAKPRKEGKEGKPLPKKPKAADIDPGQAELRLKRIKEKLRELADETGVGAASSDDEDEGGDASAQAGKKGGKGGKKPRGPGRQGKTLIVEFSIENAMTVKRREEKVQKFREKGRDMKRKRDARDDEDDEENEEAGDGDHKSVDKRKGRNAKPGGVPKAGNRKGGKPAPATAAEPDKAFNRTGAVIGKKRRLAKMNKGKH